MHSQGLWDEEDGFFYDVFHAGDGTTVPIKVRSIVGVLPADGDGGRSDRSCWRRWGPCRSASRASSGRTTPALRSRVTAESFRFPTSDAVAVGVVPPARGPPRPGPSLRRGRVPLAVRAAGAVEVPRGPPAVGRPRRVRTSPSTTSRPSRAPACSAATPTGGGRSGCRSTTCVLRNLQRYARSLGATARDRVPDRKRPDAVALAVVRRRPAGAADLAVPAGDPTAADRATAGSTKLQDDPRWRDNITFNEYFHGDNGAGLGASHQTGWTGLVADLICRPDPFAGTAPWEL